MLLDNNITHTKERVKQFHKMKLSVPVMPTPVIVKTVENIAAQLSGMPRSPSEFEIEPTYKRLLIALENRTLDSVNPRDLKIAPYALWYGSEKLGGNPDFLNFYLGWLKENPLPSNWRRLIYVYLKDFGYSVSFANSYAIMSKAIRSAFSHPDLKARLEQWKTRHEKYGIFAENFDLKKACKAFTSDANLDWQEFSSITGLEGELNTAGYAEAIGVEFLNQLNASSKGEFVKSVQHYHLADKRLRFVDKRVQVIEALLSPWVKGGTSIGDDVRKSVQEWLLLQFHDPRLPVHERSGWRDVRSDYKKVMFRWLVGESLDQFFAIIDQMALEHQWKYRKAFWKAYHEKGMLDEAWVALGPDAKFYAKRIFGNNLSAGELDGGTHGSQSVLIVRIKDLILAEWSHNGKCRAWKIDG
jgi:predicted outer membrane lipoprotein